MDDRRAFARASWANVVGNLVKIGAEGWVGLTFGSVGLIADAAHGLADLLASMVVLIWGRFSFIGPDPTHPHGHERIEPLTGLFVGAVLVVLSGRLFYDAGMTILHGTETGFDPILLGGLGIAIADKALVYWYTQQLNREVDTTSLDALAKDCLNDVYASGGVVVGVLGIAAGYPILDPLAGGVVGGLVLYQGLDIAHENVGYLVGTAAPMKTYDRVRETVLAHPAIHGIHDLRAFYMGQTIEVELHAEIDADHTLQKTHEIETDLRERTREIPDVDDVHIHFDPSGIGEWKDETDPPPPSGDP